jgi:4-hydroxy-4-methyl-2-oxoglutarate aldolase
VAAAAQAREDKEAATRARLESGELGLDIYAMRDKLKAAGLQYYEDPEDAK